MSAPKKPAKKPPPHAERVLQWVEVLDLLDVLEQRLDSCPLFASRRLQLLEWADGLRGEVLLARPRKP